MKTNIKSLMVFAIAAAVFFTSCKKDNSPADNSSSELTTHADDQARFSFEDDAITDDANTVIGGLSAFSGRTGTTLPTDNLLCNGLAVLDSAGGIRTITVTYSGLNCSQNLDLNGVVTYSMPVSSHWIDAGAVLTITAQNLQITRVRDNKRITLNGIKTITNVSGGLLQNLSSLGTITHDIASNGFTITFDNGVQRIWKVAKRRVFTYNNGIVITTTGTHTEGLIQHVSEWGTNRFGNPFVTSISEPLVVRQDCDFRLVSGQVMHERMIVDVVVTFGLNASGNTTSCPGTGVPYYFKCVWTGLNGNTRTVILPY